MKKALIGALCLVLIASSLSISASTETAEQRVYQWMTSGLPAPNVENTPFSYGREDVRDTYLVQDTFIGNKAQLKPISDFFLSQPWYYWACQTLDGRRTRSLKTVFGYRFGETFTEAANILGSVASIRGILNVEGNQLGADATLNDVLTTPAVKAALQEAVGQSFPDVHGDEWYADTVGLAVMLGIIGGRPHPSGTGLIFDGDAHLTRAEWIVMLNRLLSPKDYEDHISRPAMSMASTDGVVPLGTWFLQDYNLLVGPDGGLTGLYSLDELSQPISRAEAALFMNHCGHSFNYPIRFQNERLQEYRSAFPDMMNLNIVPQEVTVDGIESLVYRTRMVNYLNGLSVSESLDHARQGLTPFPFPLFSAIMRLNLNGVMNGYADGNIYPFEPLTRAQALALLFKACQLYPSPFLDNFDT